MRSESHSVAHLCAQLRALPLPTGRPLMMHVGMRKVGPVEGGAAGLIAAVREAIGPLGTLLMVLDAKAGVPFEYLTTPVDVEEMGITTEVFRCTPGVKVSDHAAARFAALGPDAEALLEPAPLHHYFARGTTLERFAAMQGSVLRLGADIDTVTLTHHAEYLADLPNKRHVTRRVERADIGMQEVESLDDTDGIVDWPEGDYFTQLFVDFLASGKVSVGSVGNCRAELFDGQTFVAFAVDWLERTLRPHMPVSDADRVQALSDADRPK